MWLTGVEPVFHAWQAHVMPIYQSHVACTVGIEPTQIGLEGRRNLHSATYSHLFFAVTTAHTPPSSSAIVLPHLSQTRSWYSRVPTVWKWYFHLWIKCIISSQSFHNTYSTSSFVYMAGRTLESPTPANREPQANRA